jgi:hypothetical protein
MLANNRILLAALVLLPLVGGCGSKFAGEWVQESRVLDDGSFAPVSSDRRLALQFIPPSSVRIGSYSDASRVVEDDSVSSSDYQTLQNRSVAQFGAYTARVEAGELITYVNGHESGRFRRLQGPSVFPPLVKLPKFVHGGPSVGGPLLPAVTLGEASSLRPPSGAAVAVAE